MRILFCQLRAYGDIIRTFPLLDAVKNFYPDAFIGYTCHEETAEVCRLCESIDAIITQPKLTVPDKTEGGTRIFDCRALKSSVEKIRSLNFDIYVDLHGIFQSALIGSLSNIPIRLGRGESTTKDGAYLFYTHIKDDLPENKMERHFELFRQIFHAVKPIKNSSDWQKKNIVSIFPGSSQLGILKRWSMENYLKLTALIYPKYRVRFVFGPAEKNLIPARSVHGIFFLEDWQSAKKIIDDSRAVVGNDSAYLHMAIWRQVPTVMIFGATSHEINGVWKYGLGANVFPKNSCGECDVWSGICPKNHDCMESITPIDVYKKLREYL